MMKEVAIKYYPKDCTEIMHVSGPFFSLKGGNPSPIN